MGKLTLVAAALLAGCGSPPAAIVTFVEADASDACLTQEATWFDAELQRTWISADDDGASIAHGCVEGAVGGWDALASHLRKAGDLLTDVPVGRSFQLYLLAVKEDGCPGADGPRQPIDFCAFTIDPVTIREDEDVHVQMERYCQGRITKDDCYSFAENARR
jgi:hypothetical protein